MATVLAFVAALAVAVGVSVFAGRNIRIGRLADGPRRFVARLLLGLVRRVSAFADMFLTPGNRPGSPTPFAYGLWTAFWAVFAIIPLGLAWAFPDLPFVATAGWLLVVAGFVHALMIASAYIIVSDSFDLMDSGPDVVTERIVGGRAAARPGSIAIALLFLTVCAGAVGYWFSVVWHLAIFEQLPDSGLAAVDYAVGGLRALPTDIFLEILDRLTGSDTTVVFGNTAVASIYFAALRTIGLLALFAVVTIGVRRARQRRRILNELAASDVRNDAAIERVHRAPRTIRESILAAALTPALAERQRRLIVAAREIGMLALVRRFVGVLDTQPLEIQSFGLDQCLEMFRQRARQYDGAKSEAVLAAACETLQRGRLAVEPTKRLLRLMTSILVVKRGDVEVTGRLRDAIEKIVRAELEGPRAATDSALRGFLRDLQSSLNRPMARSKPSPHIPPADEWLRKPLIAENAAIVVQVPPLTALPAPADQAPPPDSLPPTVH